LFFAVHQDSCFFSSALHEFLPACCFVSPRAFKTIPPNHFQTKTGMVAEPSRRSSRSHKIQRGNKEEILTEQKQREANQRALLIIKGRISTHASIEIRIHQEVKNASNGCQGPVCLGGLLIVCANRNHWRSVANWDIIMMAPSCFCLSLIWQFPAASRLIVSARGAWSHRHY
jgi:hypothetical protein